MSSGHIARHRNYDELLEKHQRHVVIRRIAVACIYVILLIALLAIYIVSKRHPANTSTKPPATASVVIEKNLVSQSRL